MGRHRLVAGRDPAAATTAAAATGTEPDRPGTEHERPSAEPARPSAAERAAARAARVADPSAPLELEDDDWQLAPPPRTAQGKVAAARAADPGRAYAAGRPPAKRRWPFGNPAVLLALYSLAGIGLLVIAVSLLSGSLGGLSGDPQAPEPEPVASVAPQATPAATPAAPPEPSARPSSPAAAGRPSARTPRS